MFWLSRLIPSPTNPLRSVHRDPLCAPLLSPPPRHPLPLTVLSHRPVTFPRAHPSVPHPSFSLGRPSTPHAQKAAHHAASVSLRSFPPALVDSHRSRPAAPLSIPPFPTIRQRTAPLDKHDVCARSCVGPDRNGPTAALAALPSPRPVPSVLSARLCFSRCLAAWSPSSCRSLGLSTAAVLPQLVYRPQFPRKHKSISLKFAFHSFCLDRLWSSASTNESANLNVSVAVSSVRVRRRRQDQGQRMKRMK